LLQIVVLVEVVGFGECLDVSVLEQGAALRTVDPVPAISGQPLGDPPADAAFADVDGFVAAAAGYLLREVGDHLMANPLQTPQSRRRVCC
jgi:hypothetical protein